MSQWNETIQYLIEQGKITEEDVREAEMNILCDADKEILDTLHTRFCSLDHDKHCNWYEEGDNWAAKDHKKWHDLFINFLRSANTIKLFPKGIAEESTS